MKKYDSLKKLDWVKVTPEEFLTLDIAAKKYPEVLSDDYDNKSLIVGPFIMDKTPETNKKVATGLPAVFDDLNFYETDEEEKILEFADDNPHLLLLTGRVRFVGDKIVLNSKVWGEVTINRVNPKYWAKLYPESELKGTDDDFLGVTEN